MRHDGCSHRYMPSPARSTTQPRPACLTGPWMASLIAAAVAVASPPSWSSMQRARGASQYMQHQLRCSRSVTAPSTPTSPMGLSPWAIIQAYKVGGWQLALPLACRSTKSPPSKAEGGNVTSRSTTSDNTTTFGRRTSATKLSAVQLSTPAHVCTVAGASSPTPRHDQGGKSVPPEQ